MATPLATIPAIVGLRFLHVLTAWADSRWALAVRGFTLANCLASHWRGPLLGLGHMPPTRSSSPAPRVDRFVLIEDDVLLCDLLAEVIRARFAPHSLRTFGDGAAGLKHCLADAPRLVVTDLMLPGVDGREIVRRVRARHPDTSFVVLTHALTPSLPAELLGLGVTGLVDKSCRSCQIESAIARVLEGGLYFSTQVPPVMGANKRAALSEPVPGVLTGREREIARLVAGGLISKEIADRLGLSPRTVEKERVQIMGKIGVSDLSGLIRWCVRHELV